MYNFNIEESFRGKKYSHNLIKQCVEKHSTHFNYPLFLHVFTNNTQAINLYKKHGFDITDTKQNDTIHTMVYNNSS